MGLSAGGGAICGGGGLSAEGNLRKFLSVSSAFFMHFSLFFDEYCM